MERLRFVDYSRVECEQFTDLADETDTMNTASNGTNGAGGVPAELARDQMQIMSLLEGQIEGLKQRY